MERFDSSIFVYQYRYGRIFFLFIAAVSCYNQMRKGRYREEMEHEQFSGRIKKNSR